MAKRKTSIRKRISHLGSTDSIGSGLLDSNTDVMSEEKAFWWNDLQENTRHSSIYAVNETARQLSTNSRIDSKQGPSEWWKNLELSDEHARPSTSSAHNVSTAIVRANVLQTSTSESEKEIELKKRKVHLRATQGNNRKSINNAFSSALEDTEVAVPLKLQKKRTISGIHSDSSREDLQLRLEDDEDNNQSLTENILKSKPSISQRRRDEKTKDQNLFQDILTEDGALSDNTMGKSIVPEEKSSKRLTNQNIDASKDRTDDQKKSMRASQAIPLESIETDSLNLLPPNVENAVLESNANETVQSSDNLRDALKHRWRMSRFTQRNSMGRNTFADALADEQVSLNHSNANVSKSSKENDIHKSPSLNSSKRSNNRSKTKIDIAHENSLIRRTRSLNAEKKQSNILVQAEDNIEASSSSSSLDNEFHRKKSIFLKTKSRVLRKSLINSYEEIFKKGNTSARKKNVSTEDNRASFERDEAATRISQVHKSLLIEESLQSKSNSPSIEDSDISFTTSSYERNTEREVPKKFNISSENKSKLYISENDDLTNASISRKNVTKTPEKQVLSSRKSARETLAEHTRTSATVDNRSNEMEIINNESDDLLDDTDIEQDASVSKRTSKSISRKNVTKTPEKQGLSSRKSARETLAEHTRTSATVDNRSNEMEIINNESDDLLDDTDIEQDASVSKRTSESISRKNVTKMPEKQVLSSRKSAREETLKEHTRTSATVDNRSNEIERINNESDDLLDDTDIEQDSNVSKRTSKSDPVKETRLTYNLRNRSETPRNIEVNKIIDNSHNDANKKSDSSMLKRISKSSPVKEARLTRNSLRSRPETSRAASENMELSKQSMNQIVDIEEVDNINVEDSEINVNIISSTRISKVSANIETHKNIETSDDEDADPGIQITQRNSTSTKKSETGSKALNRQSVQSSNKTSIKESKETTSRQKSLGKSQSYRNTPIKASNKDISSNASKLNSSKTLRKIDDFFKVKQVSTTMNKSNESVRKSQIFATEKMEKIKTELEKIKDREMAAMKIAATDKKESTLKVKNVKFIMLKQATKKKPLVNSKIVNKAFLINGMVYKPPKLPRPKYWATDRLYKFLWKHMEPKYKLATRLKSEKFVQELGKVVSLIERRKDYKNYEPEMEALMKEMARLEIISTRNDFYHFCQDFLPYEFRVKVVPMLLPGNKMNIPNDPEKLHIPLLDT